MPHTSFTSVPPSPSLRLLTHALKGIGTLVCTFVYMMVWIYTGEANTKRIREKYLQAVLRQDIPYFDTVGAGEVATRIQTDTRMSLSSLAPSTLTPFFHRSRTARHVRKGRPRRQLYRFFFYRFYHRLRSLLETRPCIVFYYSLHGSLRWHLEQIISKVRAVCIISFSSHFPLLILPVDFLASTLLTVVHLQRKSSPPYAPPTPSAPRKYCPVFTTYTSNEPVSSMPKLPYFMALLSVSFSSSYMRPTLWVPSPVVDVASSLTPLQHSSLAPH